VLPAVGVFLLTYWWYVARSVGEEIYPVVVEPETVEDQLQNPPSNLSSLFQLGAAETLGEIKSGGSVSAVSMMREVQKQRPDLLTYGEDDQIPQGSDQGIRQVADGSLDMSISSRALRRSDPYGLNAVPIARDAIAVVVHRDNPLTSITRAELEKIYTCQVNSWKEIDPAWDEGANGIDVYNRHPSSGTQQVFKEIVLGENDFCRESQNSGEGGLSFTTWEQDETTSVLQKMGEYGIYYASLNHVINDSSVKILRIDNIPPNAETTVGNIYPLMRELYVVAPQQTFQKVIDFIDYMVSPEGQEIVRQFHIPIYKLE
ncbi:MAG: substrate-binding domain-containing protein, partial [Cyanobacteria bacterium P01_A01_bin.135]